MGALFELLWWVAALTETGDVFNSHLYQVPWEIQEHLIAVGEWIAKLMGW